MYPAGSSRQHPEIGWPGGDGVFFGDERGTAEFIQVDKEHAATGGGGGDETSLEFLHFKFCTKILCALYSVFLRICAGNNSKRPLFLMSNYWDPYIICSLIFKKWHRFCRARICRFIFSPTRNTPPPPPGGMATNTPPSTALQHKQWGT